MSDPKARITALENAVTPLTARITVLENAVTPLTARISVLEEKEAARQRKKQEMPKGQQLVPEYDNNFTYAKCGRVTQNGVVWQMKDAAGAPGFPPPTDGSEANNQWAKADSDEAKAACPQSAGRRASRRRHPKKKATRRR